MSLGIRSLWRARPCVSLVQGLSSVPRESWSQLFASKIQSRCWLSSAAESPSPAERPEHAISRKTVTSTSSSHTTVLRRLSPRRLMKRQAPRPYAVMIRRPIRYSDRLGSQRSLRKHVASMKRQALYGDVRNALEKSAHDWRTTLDLMIRHTPKFGEILDFKVGIGRRTAAQARATFSELDTNIWQIQRKHHCKIHIESGFEEDEPLILSLSGTNVSVRESLFEIVRTIGRISAVRVLDQALQISLPEIWKGTSQGQLPIQLLSDGESASKEDTVTVYGHNADFVRMAQPPNYKPYQLTMRADEIPRPTLWTKSSFEQYVAKLVLARVPTHLHKSLYPTYSDHQSTVVRLLTGLFASEDLRVAVSLTALKLALRYIHTRGPMFRPAARTLFNQVQLQHLPLDAEVFQTFLTSASRASDLDNFSSILRAMLRRGHYVRAETWTAFLTMIQDPQTKLYIMKRMRSRSLHHLQPILAELGRQNVMLDIERRASTEMSIQHLLHAQDRQYGPSWLDTITLNKMIDVIGAQGNLRACHELLDSIDRHRPARPDQYTLNTMITHTKSIPQKIALLSRWPGLEPDDVTYKLLFQVAWRQRLPNMLRVTWRYGAFANLTSSHMRHTLTKLMHSEPVLSKMRAFMKAWEDVILGRSELVASRLLDPDGSRGFGAKQLMDKYIEDAGNLRPLVRLEAKLQEAYDMDMKIHKLSKEGVEVSSSMRENLTVDIPLGIKQKEEKA
ncbi:hypothetical protein EV127DRAFT_440500 [Xylaria flabelliformis]|nr:hypothetical protein EV127DRAFT_440500 [Xylaria flabelliformis]